MANRRYIDFPIAASVGNNDIVLIWQDGLNKQTTKETLLQGSPQSLAGLTDVDISALNNGQILQYNSTTSKWENVDRTDINLSQLGDVTIVAPANGQVLVYNSSTGKWENSSAGYVPYTGAVTTVNLGAQSILAGSFVKAGGTSAQFLKADGSVDSSTYGTGTVTSVALTMPTAFSVANSPVTTAGTLAVTATGTTAQYIRGDGSLATFPGLTGFVPYTGATADVNLGTHDLAAERGTFANNGSSDTLTVNHTSGSGYGIIVTKGGANEALYVSKTSGSGNAMTVVGGRTSLVDLALSSVTNTAGDFLTLSGGVVHKRTAAQTLTDIGGQAALTNPVTGTGVSGRVAYWNGTNSITSDSDLFYDATNKRLGISNPIPGSKLGIIVPNQASNFSGLDVTNTLNASFNVSLRTDFTTITAGGTGNLIFANSADRLTITSTGEIQVGSGGNITFGSSDTGIYLSRALLGPRASLTTRGGGVTYVDIANSSDWSGVTIAASGGNVLIGTTTDAGFKLDVNGTSRFSGAVSLISSTPTFNLTSTSATGYSELYFYRNTSSLTAYISSGVNENVTASGDAFVFDNRISGGNIIFRTNSGAGATERMRIISDGTIGFNGNSSIGNAGLDKMSMGFLNSNYGWIQTWTGRPLVLQGVGNNVLIGTTTDGGQKLQINGDIYAEKQSGNPSLFIKRVSLDTKFEISVQETRTRIRTWSTANDRDLYFDSDNTGTTRMIIAAGGAVTINNLGTGSVTATAGTLSTVSDSSYKVESGYIDSAIEKVLKLKPRYFYWNEKSGLPKDIRQLGFYAQEVNEALGEEAANKPKDTSTPWGISDRSMIAMLTKAIQEQQEIINDLKQKIA
jgi:hypothetical protein